MYIDACLCSTEWSTMVTPSEANADLMPRELNWRAVAGIKNRWHKIRFLLRQQCCFIASFFLCQLCRQDCPKSARHTRHSLWPWPRGRTVEQERSCGAQGLRYTSTQFQARGLAAPRKKLPRSTQQVFVCCCTHVVTAPLCNSYKA